MINTAFVLFLTGMITATLLMLYLYLVWCKMSNALWAKRKEAWLHQHREEIKNYIVTSDHSAAFIPEREYQFEALEDFFSEYLSLYKMDSQVEHIKRFIVKHFVPRYRQKLFHRKWSVRMNALYFIDLFKLEEMQEDLLRLLEHRNCTPEEAYQVYILLAEFGYVGIENYIKEEKDLSPYLLNQLLGRVIHEQTIYRYVETFFKHPEPLQLSILDIIREKNLRTGEVQDLLEGLLQDDGSNREVRIRAMKTLSTLGYITDPEMVTALVKQNLAAEERMMLARLMGSIKKDRFIPYLEQFMSDESYLVRAEAAKSMKTYRNGNERLNWIAANHSDAFARAIAREWLERRVEYE
ncbi:hypothetical protein [Ammoniphilus sp. YIM 78166]|uniref:hypothetical protein n=1 Tax=Ammoniphilus sp. YIM 78166 TaxID=1644106 RepID=UPI00106FE617|nr:hypothetical protein [Ammoniphilus sp. YIM 78166]